MNQYAYRAKRLLRANSELVRWPIVVWATLLFIPNPALPVGNFFALQMGMIYSLYLYIVRTKRRLDPAFFVFLGLAMAGIISVLAGGFATGGLDSASTNTSFVRIINLLPLLIAGVIVVSNPVSALLGAAIGITVNGVFGLYQLIAFQDNFFPLEFLYNNTQFTLMHKMVPDIVREQRIPGIFPEASAMAASIAPYALIMFAALLGFCRLSIDQSKRGTRIFQIAAVLGVALVVLSKSGQSLFLIVACAILVAVSLFSDFRLRNVRVSRVLLFIVALGAIGYGLNSVVSARGNFAIGRTKSSGNTSWAKRFDSILVGTGIWVGSNDEKVIFGLAGKANNLIAEQTQYDAVWSVLVTSIIDTGLLGLAVWIAIFVRCINQILTSRLKLVGFLVLVNWVAGVGLTTSYFSLLPVWFCLIILVYWRSFAQSISNLTPGETRSSGEASATSALAPKR